MKATEFLEHLWFNIPTQFPNAKHNADSLDSYREGLLIDYGKFVMFNTLVSELEEYGNDKDKKIIAEMKIDSEKHWDKLLNRMKKEGLL